MEVIESDSETTVIRLRRDEVVTLAAADEDRFTVRHIVWNEQVAESEVRRLTELNADESCAYFWQYTAWIAARR
jgi:hypothetical protein